MKKLYILFLLAVCSLYTNDMVAQQKTEVTMYTSMGTITIDMEDSLAPVTVDTFVARVKRGFYDGLIFHRVIDGFMIQGGDPLGNGYGGTGTTIPDEFHSSLKNIPGALSMANKGQPNTGDCQFFINLVNNSQLDNKYTVFGMVTNNFSVVQNIAKVPKDGNDKPLTDVVMDSVRITRDPASTGNIIKEDKLIKIYPNPSTGYITVDIPAKEAHVTVTDMSGRLVYEMQTQQAQQVVVDIHKHRKGIYTISIATADGNYHSKVLLQ